MSSNSTQANPIHKRSGGHDTVDRKVNFMNLQCNTVSEKRVLATTPLSDEVLKERLKAVLHNCRSALTKTKTLTDDYVSIQILIITSNEKKEVFLMKPWHKQHQNLIFWKQHCKCHRLSMHALAKHEKLFEFLSSDKSQTWPKQIARASFKLRLGV